jgi:formate hydrogenlyase transcriptional activator
MGKRIEHVPQKTLNAFISYPWPGNVRELQNLIERAVILSDNGVLANPLPASREAAVTLVVGDGTFQDSERVLILKALRAAGGMIGGPYGAATRLGLKRTSLISKMKRLGLYRPRRQNKINRLNEELSVSATMANSWSDTIEPDMTGT